MILFGAVNRKFAIVQHAWWDGIMVDAWDDDCMNGLNGLKS